MGAAHAERAPRAVGVGAQHRGIGDESGVPVHLDGRVSMPMVKYIKGILSRESGELFMGYLKERLSKVFAEHLKPTLDSVPDSYVLNHMVSSFAETVRWWLRDHPDYTPEEVAAFYLAVVPLEQ